MNIITWKKLQCDIQKYSDAAGPIKAWYSVAKSARWKCLDDVQKTYPKAESVGNFTVFNIKGNKYRLIVDIRYEMQTIFYKYFLTHAEYDKEKWKNDPYF